MAKRKTRKTKPSRKPPSKPEQSAIILKADAARLAVLSAPEKLEQVLIVGDLAVLTAPERVDYYKRLCQSLGLNHLTRPFEYILFKEYGSDTPAKLSLYAKKDCTEQLRRIHQVSVVPPLRKQFQDSYYIVEADLRSATGKTDTATGVVPLWRVKNGQRIDFTGVEYANALMKAETKAKRRGTLSICGLGILDESELDGVEVVGGVTPEGRIWRKDGEDPARIEAHEASQKILQEKLSGERPLVSEPVPPEPKKAAAPPAPAAKPVIVGHITIDYTDSETHPQIQGDIQQLYDALVQGAEMKWDSKVSFNRIPQGKVEFVRQMCEMKHYQLKEIFPRKVSPVPPQTGSRAMTDRRPANRTQGSTGATPEPVAVKGFVERLRHVTTENGRNMAYVTLLVDNRKQEYSSWNKTINDHLEKGKGKECIAFVVTKGKYRNLVGLKSVGSQTFEKDGVTPIIQNKEREAGTKTLW